MRAWCPPEVVLHIGGDERTNGTSSLQQKTCIYIKYGVVRFGAGRRLVLNAGELGVGSGSYSARWGKDIIK